MKVTNFMMTLKMCGIAMIMALSGCTSQESKKKGTSSLMSLRTEPRSMLQEGGDPAALGSYLVSNGYFPKNGYPAGTGVLFSTSYEIVSDGAGQGYGSIGQDGNFNQQGNNTTQLLLCPGATSIGSGPCAWQFNGPEGYAQLAFDVVSNRRSRLPARIHPGYETQMAQQVSYEAKTAGQSTGGQDAIEVVLKGRESTARLVFEKNVGLVAVVFQEGSMPAGTAEVFIGGSGSSGNGVGRFGQGDPF